MIEKIGRPAMLEQLAEEATELAQACLKLAKKERGENPTPKSKAECERELIEEFTDVIQCARELKLKPDEEQIEEKAQRFLTRWIAKTQSDIEKKRRTINESSMLMRQINEGSGSEIHAGCRANGNCKIYIGG